MIVISSVLKLIINQQILVLNGSEFGAKLAIILAYKSASE
jgi:hypothetical protein